MENYWIIKNKVWVADGYSDFIFNNPRGLATTKFHYHLTLKPSHTRLHTLYTPYTPICAPLHAPYTPNCAPLHTPYAPFCNLTHTFCTLWHILHTFLHTFYTFLHTLHAHLMHPYMYLICTLQVSDWLKVPTTANLPCTQPNLHKSLFFPTTS